MKSRGKVISFIMALLCMVPLIAGLAGFGNEASAAGDTVNVTLHKKKMDQFPTAMKNPGEVTDAFDHFQPLEGVTFTPYDVTTAFYAALDEELAKGTDYDDAVKLVVKDFALDPSATPAATGKATDSDGKVEFKDLAKRTAGGIYKVYFFKEDVPADYEEYEGYPTLLVLPAMKADGTTPIEDIHLYPKNKLKNEENPKKELLDDEGNPLTVPADGYYVYDIGKVVSYKASFTFPSQIGEILHDVGTAGVDQTRYSKFELKDEVSVEGMKFEGISEIWIGGVKLDTAARAALEAKMPITPVNAGPTGPYTGKKAGFTMAAKLNNEKSDGDAAKFGESVATAEFLKKYAGQKIELVYGVSFTNETAVDVKVENDFLVNMEHDGGQADNRENDQTVPGISTGGMKFLKYEEGDKAQGLQGAEFAILKKDGSDEYYLTQDADKKPAWTKIDASNPISQADKFVSAEDGSFKVEGLAKGTYYLRETKAPHGFQLLTEDKEFEVKAGSYTTTALRYDVANVTEGGFLPSTGGMGIVAFLLVGLSLMSVAYFRYRKVQHAAE